MRTDFDCNRCNCDECSLNYEQGNMGEQKEALDMAIKALEQQPCEDTISREDAMSMILCYGNEIKAEVMDDIKASMIKLPPVTSAPKKCHNINTNYGECDQFVCSNCGIELQDWSRIERDEDGGDIIYHEYEFKYCPNCGAKIDEREEE